MWLFYPRLCTRPMIELNSCLNNERKQWDNRMTTFQKANYLQFLCSWQYLFSLPFSLFDQNPEKMWAFYLLLFSFYCLNNARKQWDPIVHCQRIQTKTCCELCLGSEDHIVGDGVAVDLNAFKVILCSGKNLWT